MLKYCYSVSVPSMRGSDNKKMPGHSTSLPSDPTTITASSSSFQID